MNKKENLSSERCGFRNIDGTSKISYNFTECGTGDAEITQQNIIYKGVLFHKVRFFIGRCHSFWDALEFTG